MKFSSLHIRTLITILVSISILGAQMLPLFVETSRATTYVDADGNSFVYFKQRLTGALEDLEREYRLNNSVTDSSLANVRNTLQEAFVRLPDRGDSQTQNESLKKAADLYIDLAQKNKGSSTHVQNAIAQVSRFLTEVSIDQITGSISANPTSGNAPLTSSFLATAKDPSGINIPDKNFIWWMRESGGYRKELGRSPTLTYTFPKEGNYQIFLDVISESRNKKGRTDVTPLSLSQDIEVKPRLGNIILLINGVNVSNLDTLKVSPNIAKVGLLFDATASRAVSNGTIIKTRWDFGNGEIREYDGSPILERQIYTIPEMYKVSLTITTNQGQTFTKDIQMLVRDPSAVISLDKESSYIGESIQMSTKSYLANTTNVEYNWDIQDIESGKKTIASKVGSSFVYKFSKIGQYLITLTTRSPNGNTDADSRIIMIESRPPMINLDSPKPISPEKPNTIYFDASRSFDPDTNNSKGLTYEWTIDGEKVELNNPEKEGAIGTLTFTEKGNHTIGLTITNPYGKISTIDKVFDVTSTLTVGMNITPRATPIGNTIHFQARSPQARFFEWNLGDGSPSINGTSDFIEHIYKKTGVYSATLVVKNSDGSEENTIMRKIYITDTDTPYALIDIKNQNGSAIEDPGACGQEAGAFVINRTENTTIDGSNSINVDGNASGISYTWRYLDTIKTGPSLSEKFTELGCFPIELTVKSDKTGATHSSTRYLQIKNLLPKITSVSASIDGTKKDTQKLVVNVVANGARDDDGVITSYIWFYKTESDQEKQNIRITQTPATTFVLPNVTEKYYFGVIVEDNDGARYDSSDNVSNEVPLLVANDDANINMPLITLNVDKTQALTDESIVFSASAKNILGTDITTKSEYFWDFDGDGRVDQKTTDPQTSYTYKKSGKYNMKLKVVSNGSSNTKYQVIYVKNELKASVSGYRIGDMTYILNTSRGTYDAAKWSVGGIDDSSLYEMSIPNALLSTSGSLGNLTVKYGASEMSTFEITDSVIQNFEKSTDGINIQSSPLIESGSTITLTYPGEKLLISMHGNAGNEYIIDSDTKIDSDLDAVGDNDKDNKDTSSYRDGSVFFIDTITESKTRTHEIKLSILDDAGKLIGTKNIQVILDYIKEDLSATTKDTTGSGSESFSTVDKENLAKLQEMIRALSPENRIIFTQLYNTLIDNWGDLHDRTEGLLALQEEVISNTTLEEKDKVIFSDSIDTILVGDAQSVNDVSVASRVIEGLIAVDNANRSFIIERLEQIKSHPGNLSENKILGKEILEKIQSDASISTENKILIKSQLLTIINGGQESIPQSESEALANDSSPGNGFIGFIGGAVKIFFIVIAIILALLLFGYIFYRISRKDNDTGFPDFLIDSVAHTRGNKSPSQPNTKKSPIDESASIVMPVKENPIVEEDPLESIGAYHEESPVEVSPLPAPVTTESTVTLPTQEATPTPTETNPTEDAHLIPDWLKPVTQDPLSWNKDDSDSIVIKSTPPSPDQTIASVGEDSLLEATEDSQAKKSESGISESESVSEEVPSENTQITGGNTDDPLVGGVIEPEYNNPSDGDHAGDDIQESEIMDPLAFEENDSEIIQSEPSPGDNALETLSTKETEEDIIPDWLRPTDPTPQAPEVKHIEIDAEEISNPPIIVEPSPNAELPEWLRNAAENTDPQIQKEKKSPKTKEKKAPPKEPKEKKLPSQKSAKMNVPHPDIKNDDIPDWLK